MRAGVQRSISGGAESGWLGGWGSRERCCDANLSDGVRVCRKDSKALGQGSRWGGFVIFSVRMIRSREEKGEEFPAVGDVFVCIP